MKKLKLKVFSGKNYEFIKVKRELIDELNLTCLISKDSKVLGEFVYLDSTFDGKLFEKAILKRHNKTNIFELVDYDVKHSKGTLIKSFDSYEVNQ